MSRRRLSAYAAGLIFIVGTLLTTVFFVLRGSIQTRGGDQELAGLSAPATVTFDQWAVPRIRARTELDAARAQGFVHASERLWQLEFFLRIAHGRLAEVFGEPLIATDRLLRTLDLWGAAGRELASLSESDVAQLDAYAEGVNARIDSWRGLWPPEFLILGIEPQRWSPQATVAIGRIMSLDLSGWRTELSRISALARLGADRRHALGAGYPVWGPTILQDELPEGTAAPRGMASGLEPATRTVATTSPASTDPGADIDPLGFLSAFGFHASNSWVIGGERTADGHPLLANDMHLALRAPSTWYLNAIETAEPDRAFAGLSIPGTPGVIVGLNRQLAWAFTNAMVDDADFVIESVNLDASMYRDADGWKPFETREEEIRVRGRESPETWVVRHTARGPVITDAVPSGGVTLSLLWTGLEPAGAVSAIIAMNTARTADELDVAIQGFRSPHQNVIYATTDGQIGYRMSGSVPERDGVNGAIPLPPARFVEGWPGFWEAEAMPALRAPASGYLSSANNLQARTVFGLVGVSYPAPFRARRIDDLVSTATGWTVDDMRATQIDSYSLLAERLRPRALAAARRIGADSLAKELESWDLRAETDRHGVAPFYVWFYRLRQLVTADEYDEGDGYFPDLAFLEILDDPESPWHDDARTPATERLAELEEEAARTAAGAVGSRWGDVHLERSAHPLGQLAVLDKIFGFHVGPYPARGGRHTVRPDDPGLRGRLDSTAWRLPSTGEYGPSQRFIAHLTPEGARGYFLLPTGQAGNPLDRHYRDMAREWAASRLIEISPGREPLESESVLRLNPGPR